MNFKSCNKILVNTHKKDNIKLLEARDYYFNKARLLNSYKIFFILISPIILSLTYIPFSSNFITFFDTYRDIFIGVITVLAFIIILLLNKQIDINLEKSNTLREEYDLRVFEIEANNIIYDNKNVDKYLSEAKNKHYHNNYGSWYAEVFSDNHLNNILCCQLDNCIYTYVIYSKYKKRIEYQTITLIFITILLTSLSFIFNQFSTIILIIFSLFSVFQYLMESSSQMKVLIEDNKKLENYVMNELKVEDVTPELIRSIQDVIMINRKNSLFVPKSIRRKSLVDDGEYRNELNLVQNKFCKNPHMIENAEDIPVLPTSLALQNKTKSEDVPLTNMNDVHSNLLTMLDDIVEILDKEKIDYTLDGGTLIAAIRDKGKILFWDDDVDLIIPYSQLAKIKEVLKNNLSEKYVVQDPDNELYYSPRLSDLRVRETHNYSFTSENDSPLYELYERRGLFLDIYSYSPIIINPKIDSLYRHLFLNPTNKKLLKVENLFMDEHDESKKEKYRIKFIKLKKKYQKKIIKYTKLGKSKKYVSYTPNYIESYKKCGPYIPSECFAKRVKVPFEGTEYYVPVDYVGVLEKVYGEKWNESPYKGMDELKAIAKKKNLNGWISLNKFKVSDLKHMKYIDIVNLNKK